MAVELRSHQRTAADKLRTGKVLCGGVGSGKTMTSLVHYIEKEAPKDLYVITTAKKRDSLDWEHEAAKFGIGKEPDATLHGVLRVDSWNNIAKYVGVQGAHFILDEQRLVGSGVWAKSFLKIAKANSWILLSATPGDTWLDYIPVFVANGFYKNRTEFKRNHVIFAPYTKYPKIDRYVGTRTLEKHRKDVLVEMPYERHTTRHVVELDVDYDKALTDTVAKHLWNPFEEKPLKDVAEMYAVTRRVMNSDASRIEKIKGLLAKHNRLIVFYNFNYELEILRGLNSEYTVAEWNGHKHQPIPDTDRWVYLVQYAAGAEGWNCIETDAMAFYSETYSYRMFEQAQGRIDRLNTPYANLFYYMLTSGCWLDRAIRSSRLNKEVFNETRAPIPEVSDPFGDDWPYA